MDDGHRPDALEKGIRFGCGFVAGAIVVFWLLIRELTEIAGVHWAIVAGGAVACGLLAARFGDRFWHHAVRSWWWW